jgi:hypothetical protein
MQNNVLRALLTLIILTTFNLNNLYAQTPWYDTGNNAAPHYKLGTTNAYDLKLITNDTTRMIIKTNGHIGIGTDKTQGFLLTVDGRMRARGIRVYPGTWSDYVFKDKYNYLPISDLEIYLMKNKHLPNVPDEKTVLEKGIDVGEMNAILLEQIEILNLRLIDMDKKLKALEAKQGK